MYFLSEMTNRPIRTNINKLWKPSLSHSLSSHSMFKLLIKIVVFGLYNKCSPWKLWYIGFWMDFWNNIYLNSNSNLQILISHSKNIVRPTNHQNKQKANKFSNRTERQVPLCRFLQFLQLSLHKYPSWTASWADAS